MDYIYHSKRTHTNTHHSKLGKTKENIEYYLDSKNDKDYLQDLLLNIKNSYTTQEILTFKIIELKEKGFTVKVGGLFAYISFKYLGWSYPSIEFWKNVSNHLIGIFFRGKIHSVSENPISIRVDASDQHFEKPNLEKYAEYHGVILHKAKYGIFVDLGFHFNWKFGSLLGLIHKSTLVNQSDYDNWNVGDQTTTVFQGYNDEGQLVLGNNQEHRKWVNGEMDKLIGSTQKIRVVVNETNQPEFYVLGEHRAKIPINKEFYPNLKTTVKKYISGLENGQIIDCEVIRINKRKDCFILKLLIEPPIN